MAMFYILDMYGLTWKFGSGQWTNYRHYEERIWNLMSKPWSIIKDLIYRITLLSGQSLKLSDSTGNGFKSHSTLLISTIRKEMSQKQFIGITRFANDIRM